MKWEQTKLFNTYRLGRRAGGTFARLCRSSSQNIGTAGQIRYDTRYAIYSQWYYGEILKGYNLRMFLTAPLLPRLLPDRLGMRARMATRPQALSPSPLHVTSGRIIKKYKCSSHNSLTMCKIRHAVCIRARRRVHPF